MYGTAGPTHDSQPQLGDCAFHKVWRHLAGPDWEGATDVFMVLGITSNAAKHPTMPRVGPPSPLTFDKYFIWSKMLVVPRLRNSALKYS